MQAQVGVGGVGRRLVQVGGHAHLAADPHPPHRVFPLVSGNRIGYLAGTGRPQARIGKPEAERGSRLRDRDNRDSPC